MTSRPRLLPRLARLRSVPLGLTAIAAMATLAACGADSGGAVATDASASSATASPSTSTSTSPSPSPTAEPTVGTYPSFPHADYAYTLEQRCFCANIDQRYRITVADGEVQSVTWATAGDGHQVGDPVSNTYVRLTIDDIIDQANDTTAAKVDVDWPAGQDYPSSVSVDKDKMVADEEVTWVISEVQTA